MIIKCHSYKIFIYIAEEILIRVGFRINVFIKNELHDPSRINNIELTITK